MPHRHLGHRHEAQNVGRHRIDIQFQVKVTIQMPCAGTDDDQVSTVELVEQFLEDRRGITVRHIDAPHDRLWRECLAKGFESIKPAGQEP